ncbi:hypothetical protein [Brevundimonas subvibrioides]|uniref:hypothetical protein n=1 Tax=Brevundimonas subvibrioides TaxID=74313 RepID=UPI0022B47C71|nr:hypothetical protein [Brevundimonas subvibrioides]
MSIQDGQTSIPTAVQRLERAEDVADWARAERDPLAMVVAARMSRGVGIDDPLAPERLLAEARLMARGDATVLAVVAEEEAAEDRGVCVGPTRSEGLLSPGQRQSVRLRVAGGEIADAALRLPAGAPGGADLDLIVTDMQGRRIAALTGPDSGVAGRAAYVQWRPDYPSDVDVSVLNVSRVSTTYRLTLAPSQGGRCR